MENGSPNDHSPADGSPRPSSSASTSSTGSGPVYALKEGEFLHDANNGSERTLEEFARLMSAKDLYDVFFDYTAVIQADTKQSAAAFDEHWVLNRYKDIRCIDATRVKAPRANGEHDYIHANYVDGYREKQKFILSQAPLADSLEQFWKLVWTERVLVVVAVSALDGRRCARYIPTESGQQLRIGAHRITHRGTRHIRDTYDATVLQVEKDGEVSRTVLHIAYYTWPDKGTPRRPTETLHLLDDINHNRTQLVAEGIRTKWLPENAQSPILIHCVTGVGRSASLAALDVCLRKLDATRTVNVQDTVQRMRSQREMAVQKPLQFLFLHLAVLEYALRKRYFDDIDCIDLRSFMAKLAPAGH